MTIADHRDFIQQHHNKIAALLGEIEQGILGEADREPILHGAYHFATGQLHRQAAILGITIPTHKTELVLPDRHKAAGFHIITIDRTSTITITDRHGTVLTRQYLEAGGGWIPDHMITELTDDRYPLTVTTTVQNTDGVQTLTWGE